MGPQQKYFNDPQFKWAPNNDIDPGSLGLHNLIFDNQFKWAPNLNWLPTTILIQRARAPSI